MSTRLDIGDLLGTTAKVIASCFAPLLVISAVCMAPLFVLGVAMVFAQGQAEAIARQLESSPEASSNLMGGMIAFLVLFLLLFVLLNLLSQGAVLHVTIERLAGRSATVGSAVRVTMSRFWPLLGTSILVSLAVAVGSLLCILPGIILGCMFYVAVPITVAEGIGGAEAMRRSAALTEGNRWMIFLTGAIVVAIMFALVLVTSVVAAPFQLLAEQQPALLVVPSIIDFARSALQSIVQSVLVGVIYVRLRGVRDGIDVQALAEVFR